MYFYIKKCRKKHILRLVILNFLLSLSFPLLSPKTSKAPCSFLQCFMLLFLHGYQDPGTLSLSLSLSNSFVLVCMYYFVPHLHRLPMCCFLSVLKFLMCSGASFVFPYTPLSKAHLPSYCSKAWLPSSCCTIPFALSVSILR